MTTNDQAHYRAIDQMQTQANDGLGNAALAFEELAAYHTANTVPRGYSRSANDIQLYRDVATLLRLVQEAMGEEGITTSEDHKMTKAMECLGLTWR